MENRFLVSPFKFGAERNPNTDPPAAIFQNGLAVTDAADLHLRDKIMAILFTAPGERVNQPRFGVGLTRTVFEGLNELTVAAVEFRITEGLRRDLGGEANVTNVEVETEDEAGRLLIRISYLRRSDREPRNLEVIL